ncbi:glycosyltransferase family 4 protein [Methanocorpusculum sp. GPch4]|uniref:glycosyltransferase family 4 protein n=1 Tax=Methanocorpusculum sp. GPch4 TaxID=2527877 RepID=UPI001432981C|nr:glycosyltransferase family 4 protein [Methanocorpusculum sp. GPch4]
MKILQILTYFSPKMGGEYNVCYNLSKTLCEMGHDVTILTTDVYYDFRVDNSLSNLLIVPFHCVSNIAGFLYTPSMKSWLANHIREYDIVHIHGYRGYQTIIAAKYALKYSIPYVIQPHGSFPRIIAKQSLKKLYDIVWGNKVLKGAQKIIAVSRFEQTSLIECGIEADNILVIYNGLPVERFLTYVSRDTIVSDDNRNNKTILYLGRLNQRKGIDILIRAFYQLTFKMPNVLLRIAGSDDGYKNTLVNLCHNLQIEDKVEFLDFVKDDISEYKYSDVLVYPSIAEIFGLVPFEAILSGTPVIVTDDCGCGEIIQEMDAGYLVHYGDVMGLANQIEYVLTHPLENSHKVQKGKEYIINHLSWTMIAKEYLQEYESQIMYPDINNDILHK